MKKRFIAMMFSAVMALSVMSCAKADEEAEPVVTEEPAEADATKDADETKPAESPQVDKNAVFQSYLDSMPKLADTTFKINGGYDANEGIYGIVEGKSGLLYWIYTSGGKLITAEYDATKNCLTYKTLDVNEAGEIEVFCEMPVEKLIMFNDDIKILFSEFTTENNQDVIMVESRGMAYTYADGVQYYIDLIEIHSDGTLTSLYGDGLAGSGDEDITSDIRAGFNSAVGHEYTKDEFEDIFYNGNMFIEQEGMPVHASIEFKSESSKYADVNDWDNANVIPQKIYELMDNPDGEPVYWGEGKFVADSFK